LKSDLPNLQLIFQIKNLVVTVLYPRKDAIDIELDQKSSCKRWRLLGKNRYDVVSALKNIILLLKKCNRKQYGNRNHY